MMKQPALRHPGGIRHRLHGKCCNTLLGSEFRRAIEETAANDLRLLFPFMCIFHVSEHTGRLVSLQGNCEGCHQLEIHT
jgi:hypothetical protein